MAGKSHLRADRSNPGCRDEKRDIVSVSNIGIKMPILFAQSRKDARACWEKKTFDALVCVLGHTSPRPRLADIASLPDDG